MYSETNFDSVEDTFSKEENLEYKNYVYNENTDTYDIVNIDGQYDTDFLDCSLWTGIAESTAEYCKKGDIVGIRGRVQ